MLAAVAVTIVRALTASDPNLGFGTSVNGDAEALYLGHWIYQDPSHGYTGLLYTPLFPFVVSLLDHIRLWASWPVLLNFAAALSIVGLVSYLAYDREAPRGRDRLLALVGAVGVGGIAWWLVSTLTLNALYEGRTDHMAWALALFGLLLVARGATGSSWTLAAGGLLLSAAFWTKQPAVLAALVAALWMLGAAALGVVGWRRAIAFGAGLALANLALFGLLDAITDGWLRYFTFDLGQKGPKFASFWPSVREFLRTTAIAIALPVLLAAGIALRARSEGAPLRIRAVIGALRESSEAQLVSLLVAFIVVGAPAAVYFRLKIGSDTNQYIGVVWALGMLGAVAYRHARARAETALLSAALIVPLFLFAQRPTDAVGGIRIAPLVRTTEYPDVAPGLRDYSRTHLVYHQVQSDLNVHPQRDIYPSFYNFMDLLSAGRQPIYLVNALIDRRFDAVAPFRFRNADDALYWDIYASGMGRRESGYFWKLNQVIRAGYRPAPGVPPGFLARRPGPTSTWLRSCFSPFHLAGRSFVIRAGGGLWCRQAGQVLVLRGTPAPVSEVHASEPVSGVSGALGVRLSRPGVFAVALRGGDGGGWRIEGRFAAGRMVIREFSGEREASRVVVRPQREGAQVRLSFSEGNAGVTGRGADVDVTLPGTGSGDLSITATRGSGATFQFGDLGLR